MVVLSTGLPMHILKRIGAAIVACMALIAYAEAALAQAGSGAVRFTPHRAVYDITLDHTLPSSGISEMTGRMVYELQGSECEGYTQNMRFVTRTVGPDGSRQLNDLRTSSWEEPSGKRLRFNSNQYRNKTLASSTRGDAARMEKPGGVKIHLEEPTSRGIALEGKIYFPMQHSLALIAAARKGERIFTAELYDGSDRGEKVYLTNAFIGSQLDPAAKSVGGDIEEAKKLEKLPAWPVAISYYEPGSEKQDSAPTYELSFRFFDNGVSTSLHIDYGDFAIRGRLSDLEFLGTTDCGVATD